MLTLVFAPMQETVRMAQVHVLTGPERRRRFNLEEKRRLVGAAFAPGAVVSEVARQADVCASLIYRWRRELGQVPGGFAEVIVAPMIRGGGDGADDLRCLSASPRVEAARFRAASMATPSIEMAAELRACGLRIDPVRPGSAVIAALRRRDPFHRVRVWWRSA